MQKCKKDDAIKAMVQFELRYNRKPTPKEMETLKKGSRLSIEKVKMAGCMINYPQSSSLK